MRSILFPLLALFLLSDFAFSQQWTDVHAPDLRMLTQGSPKQAREILWNLEQARVVFGHLLNRPKVNVNRPLLILGMQSADEIRALIGDRPMFPGGFAMAASDRNYLVIDLSSQDLSGIYRAYALLLLDANYPRAQSWFDEGLAQYIAGLRVESKKITEVAPPRVAEELASGPPQSVSQLISPNARSLPRFAASSWLLFRWLLENGQLEYVGPYLNQVMNRSIPPENAFRDVFSTTPEAVDTAIVQFMATAMSPKSAGQPTDMDPVTFTTAKFPLLEAQAIEARLRLDLPGQEDAAMSALRQMLARDPNNVEVNRGLGLASLRSGNLKDAADFIRRAIQLRDDDAYMNYLMAVLHNRGSGEAVQVDSEAPTIVMQCQRAIDRDPQLAVAYKLLAEALIATDHPDKALTTIRTGMSLSPRDEDMLLTFASVQIANKNFADARALLNFLQASDNRPVADRAREMLKIASNLKKADANEAAARRRYTDPTAPQWKPKPGEPDPTAALSADATPAQQQKPDTRKTLYLKGTLVGVHCPDDRSAELTVMAGRKTWKILVPDRSKALLIGVENFECGWSNIPVSINYKASGVNRGDLVSLEVD
jgi:tetratricopeptide (TPR) repeat protein